MGLRITNPQNRYMAKKLYGIIKKTIIYYIYNKSVNNNSIKEKKKEGECYGE